MVLLSQALIYLLVALIDIEQPVETLTVDYLLNSAPAAVLEIVPLDNSDQDAFLVRGQAADRSESNEPGEPLGPIRVEQSDLYTHIYVVTAPGTPPAVVDVSAVRAVRAGGEWSAGGASPLSATGAVAGGFYILERPGSTVVMAESESIVLVSR